MLSVDSLRNLARSSALTPDLIDIIPTLWHSDHVLHIHASLYEQIEADMKLFRLRSCEDPWKQSKWWIRDLPQFEKLWILHVQRSDRWLAVSLNWDLMQILCYDPMAIAGAVDVRQETILWVSKASPSADVVTKPGLTTPRGADNAELDGCCERLIFNKASAGKGASGTSIE
jgi:hypothetical protein